MEKNDDKESVKEILSDLDLGKALTFNRFWDFLKETKKYNDLINLKKSKESRVTFILAVLLTLVATYIAFKDYNLILEYLNSIIPVFIGGMFTILGLSLAGLAIVTATLGEKFLSIIIQQKKLYKIISIIFNFYFSGFIIGITIFLLTFALLVLKIPLPFSLVLFIIFFFVNVYIALFSIIYSIMLLGTCIRLFLVRYAIELKSKL